MSIDYNHITCSLMMASLDSLEPEQRERMLAGQNGLSPLTKEKIDQILESWREKLEREIGNHNGYVVFGWDC